MTTLTSAPTAANRQPLQAIATRGFLWRIAAILVGSWVIALSARINVPMVPVPMSMQTFAILLIAVMAGRDLAGQTLLAYLAQGAAGLPMFASGAGLVYMAGETGGYLVGFLVAALFVGALADRGWNRSALLLAGAVLIGHAIIFALGVGWLTVLMGERVRSYGGRLYALYSGHDRQDGARRRHPLRDDPAGASAQGLRPPTRPPQHAFR